MQLDLAGTSVLLVAMEVCDRFGKLEQYGTHHCKYAILFYSTGVRVIITTANFIETDFCKLTNAVYVQDFPLLESSIPTPRAESHSRFKEDLTFFLQHQAKHCFGASGRSRPRPWPQSDLGRDALNRQVMIDMIRRGEGINQKLLLDISRKLARGDWCHIFPEAGNFSRPRK